MSLSEHEQRQLAAVDRVLSGDPVLRALCELFPGPPTRGEFRVVRWTAHRLLLVMVWSVVLMAVGLVTTIVAAAVADPAVVAGPTVMLTAAAVFAVSAIRRGVRMPHLRRAAPLAV